MSSTAGVAASTATATADPMPLKPPSLPDHTHALLRSRLSAGLRSALACTLVGAANLYGPDPLRRHLTFPAFAYVTSMLILADAASLGDALRGAVFVLYGIALGLLPAMMTFYVLQPKGMSALTAAIAAVVSALVVAVSDSTALIAKRVALGQIVLVYVSAFKQAAEHGGRPVLLPLPVAASTATGALAAVLALLLPYPKLACFEVRERSKMYSEMATERARLLVDALCADNVGCMVASLSRAKYLARISSKLLHTINSMHLGSVQWESPPLKFLPTFNRVSLDRLQSIETSLRGMELALASTKSHHQQHLIKETMAALRGKLATTKHQNSDDRHHHEAMDTALQSLRQASTPHHLPSFFFLFCTKLLHDQILVSPSPEHKVSPAEEKAAAPCKPAADQKSTPPPTEKKKREFNVSFSCDMMISSEKAVAALKCALSLGLAVLCGLIFSRNNGYWTGLTVAIAFAPSRQATFALATVRAHGTALGSVYGLLGSFISQNLMELRLLAIIPWVFFASFLHRSRTYGSSGALSAAISAIIILGRRNYGPPMIFAIQRLTEVYIGLGCSVLVELLLQPGRSSTMARTLLAESMQTLAQCADSLKNVNELKEKEKTLRGKVNELKRRVQEAELEPNFWFPPFPAACYHKLHSSLSTTADLLLFLARAMADLEEHGYEIEGAVKAELGKAKAAVSCLSKCLLEDKSSSANSCSAVEEGKGPGLWAGSWAEGSGELVIGPGGEEEGHVALCYGAMGFCVQGLKEEVREMEKGLIELLEWESMSCSHKINHSK